MNYKDYPHRQTVKHLVEDYARTRVGADELMDAIMELDPTYFAHHGRAFKQLMGKTFIEKGHLSPRQRVEGWQAFYEAFYDHHTDLKETPDEV